MKKIPFLFVALPFLSGCLNPQSPLSEGGGESQVPANVQNTPEYQSALQFDRFLKQNLPAEELSQLVKHCQQDPKSNDYCYSYVRAKKLSARVKRKEQVFHPHPEPAPAPVIPEIAKGKLKNAAKVRKAKVQALLSGLAGVPLEKLNALADLSLKEKRCPNNLIVATAATLEDHLPTEPLSGKIAALYSHAAHCASRRSADREHFLTRSALFFYLEKRYADAIKTLKKVRSEDAYSGRALYWLYRSQLASQDTEAAEATLKTLRNRHPLSFHALAASALKGEDPAEAWLKASFELAHRTKRSSPVNTLIQQAETLKSFGFETSAAVLADWILEDYPRLEPEVRLYTADLGDAHAKVRTLQEVLYRKSSYRTRTTLELAFPRPYFTAFEKNHLSVSPYLLLAVARKESLLDPRAVSPANAQGLLQIHPNTAAKISPSDVEHLLDPETNIRLAARYLTFLMDVMRDQVPLVIAAYNAGEDPVMRWTRRYPTQDRLLFIDLIPYRETRDYVGYVLTNYYWYKRLYDSPSGEPLRSALAPQLARIDSGRNARIPKAEGVEEQP